MSLPLRSLPVVRPAGPFAERAQDAASRARLALAADFSRAAAQASTVAEQAFRVASGQPIDARDQKAHEALAQVREAHNHLTAILQEFGL